MTKPLYVISRDGKGVGGFLCPPGHWNHEYALHAYYNGRRKPVVDGLYTIEYALDQESQAAESVQAKVHAIMASSELVCSELWLRNVYGYFRNCYAAQDGSRDVSRCRTDRTHALPAELHLAVLHVRQFFPDHQSRADLIADPGKGYGAFACLNCGLRVQYEPRNDALVTLTGSNGVICLQGDGSGHVTEKVT